MNLIRLLTVLTLLPITAMSGVPHVACRCSTGEVHLSCPRLRPSQKTPESMSCCGSAKVTSRQCCRGGADHVQSCSSSSRQSPIKSTSYSAVTCRCTPVYLTADVGLKLTKVGVPDFLQIDLADLSATAAIVLHVAGMDSRRVESGSAVPLDLIMLFERLLI